MQEDVIFFYFFFLAQLPTIGGAGAGAGATAGGATAGGDDRQMQLLGVSLSLGWCVRLVFACNIFRGQRHTNTRNAN